MVRIVVGPDAEAAVDYRGKLRGHGACAEATPRLLRHALEAPELRVEGLLSRVRAANLAAVLDLLSLSARAGALVSGADAIARLGPGAGIAWVSASDASLATLADLPADVRALPAFELEFTREALGLRIGKGPRAAVVLRPAAPTRALLAELRRMGQLA
jgi:hypothetical protein